MKCWIGVVSFEHALIGINKGFVQVCHGKAAPLKRMSADDWFVFYSPKETFEGKKSLKAFTGIGKVVNGDVYKADMGNGFMPFRIDVDFIECKQAPIVPLIEGLSFIKNKKNWGYGFRFGHLEIPESDFRQIALAMNVNIDAISKSKAKHFKQLKE